MIEVTYKIYNNNEYNSLIHLLMNYKGFKIKDALTVIKLVDELEKTKMYYVKAINGLVEKYNGKYDDSHKNGLLTINFQTADDTQKFTAEEKELTESKFTIDVSKIDYDENLQLTPTQILLAKNFINFPE